MSVEERFPVSQMARNRALRTVGETMAKPDVVERTTELIMAANTAQDVVGHSGGPHDIETLAVSLKAFRHGVRIAVSTLLEAGLDESLLPTEGLWERAIDVDLSSAALAEARARVEGKNIADFYFQQDGGNA